MRRLMLLRHAKTETDAPSGRDQDRRLDDRGRTDAAEIGAWMADHPPGPDLVLVSPATRAKQTWEIAWDAMNGRMKPPQVAFVPELYIAEPGQILETIRSATASSHSSSNIETLLLIGHNPGMHEIALMLTGSGDPAASKAVANNLPTSGLAVFEFDVEDWSEVAYRRGRLVLFVSPKVLRQA